MVWYDCWSVMIVDAFLRSEVDRHVYLLGISFIPWICYCFFFFHFTYFSPFSSSSSLTVIPSSLVQAPRFF